MAYRLPLLRPKTYSRISFRPIPLATPGVFRAARVKAFTSFCIGSF